MNVPLTPFSGYGIELEYMLVDKTSLRVLPIAEEVLTSLGAETHGPHAGCIEQGPVAWSNELAAHVIELKTNGPAPHLRDVGEHFAAAVREMNRVLGSFGARLMPTGMHPLMDPTSEFRLYPIDDEGYYAAFNRIFDCRGHGWSNLQSMHVNLPFASDDDFLRLHSLIRLLLPLLPALSASSPLVEGKVARELDHRLFVYRDNARRVPRVSGAVIPEHMRSRAEYEQLLLAPIYADLAPHDPCGELCYEWVNARGCIARFDRMALEIRVLDAQECVRADLAIASLVGAVLEQRFSDERFSTWSTSWSEHRLAEILWSVARDGDQALIADPEYLALWGVRSSNAPTAAELWRELLDQMPSDERSRPTLCDARTLLERGCLARRIVQATGPVPRAEVITSVYARLCECLDSNQFFEP